MYVKSHSYGEFIFDQAWADFAMRSLGIRYYPKLLMAIPFTPAVGKRIITDSSLSEKEEKELIKSMGNFVANLCKQNGLSGCHVNFMAPEEVDSFVESDYLLRETIQYRFHNNKPDLEEGVEEKFTDFDDYLTCFKSKRRVAIKRERKSVYEDQGIRIETISGNDDRATQELYNTMYHLYTTTVDKMWGTRYLSQEIFNEWYSASDDFKKNIIFMVAYDKEDKIVAGTINFLQKPLESDSNHKSKLFGRYWGCFEELKNLHFEACYYKAIEYCIENEIDYFEPGAGGGSFKYLRGFDPYIVHSTHYLSSSLLNNAIKDFLEEERQVNTDTADYLTANSRLKKGSLKNGI